MNYFEDWISKRLSKGKPLKKCDLVYEESEIPPDDADEAAKRDEEATGRLYYKDLQCREWCKGYGSETFYPANRRPWECTPAGDVHLYDQNGFMVTEMTSRMTDNKIAMWKCQQCGTDAQAWVTMCPKPTCAGVNPSVTRQHSNAARMDQIKKKIEKGTKLTWYELIASKVHCEASAKGEHCESILEKARKANPKATAEIRNKAKWQPKSGVRGNPTPEGADRRAMREAHKRATEDFVHIEGCAFKGVAHRFQNLVGRESEAGIPYSRSIFGAGKGYEWCLKADIEAESFKKKNGHEAEKDVTRKTNEAARSQKRYQNWTGLMGVLVQRHQLQINEGICRATRSSSRR